MLKLFILFIASFLSHPVHVSMSSLYENDDGDYGLTVRIYSDDLALDMYRLYNVQGDFNENDHIFIFKGSDDFYKKYVDDHIKVFLDGKLADKVMIEKEILDLETLLHFNVITDGRNINKIKIENKILTGLYPDQVNLFIFKVFDREEGVKFTPQKTAISFGSN